MKRIFFLYLLLTGLVLADPYRPPNMQRDIFSSEKLEIEPADRATLFTGLLSVARDFDEEQHGVGFELRSHALAIAGRLNPGENRFTEVHEDLKTRSQTVREDGSAIPKTIRKIFKGVDALMSGENNHKENLKCASYCIDIALRLDPKNDFSAKLKRFQTVTGEADWRNMLIQPSSKIPGGKAEKFPATRSSIHALLSGRQADGRLGGIACSLSAKARRAPGTDEVEFHLKPKLGAMAVNSLEELAKLMRVRHEEAGRIPSGYQVEIAFEDKDGLLDSPSAGIAMSIIIDSLFTGRDLDDSFACTGAITADGKVTRIGGVADKIRAATNKGCKLVGVSHENIEGVSDIVLLEGIETLMNTQVFSFKTLDDALKVASRDKSEEVQQTLDDFDKLARDMKGRPQKSLEDPAIIALLEKVVEKMPNHESARILLSVARKEQKKVLSLGGSFHEIEIHRSVMDRALMQITMADKPNLTLAERKQAGEAATELEKLAPKLDPRLKDYNDFMVKVSKILAEGRQDDEREKEFVNRLTKGWREVMAERNKLTAGP